MAGKVQDEPGTFVMPESKGMLEKNIEGISQGHRSHLERFLTKKFCDDLSTKIRRYIIINHWKKMEIHESILIIKKQ